MKVRLILNGKKAHLPEIRQAVGELRQSGHPVEVRVTWEGGDVERLVAEAHQEGFNSPEQKLVIGGGDGSVQEVVSALMRLPEAERPSLGILPLGTANDFATACGIPLEVKPALSWAVEAKPLRIDVVRVDDRNQKKTAYFANVLTAGFGAQITAETPVELKNFLGGGAYTLQGLVQALNFKPYSVRIKVPDMSYDGGVIVGAICNGKQAGGGQILGPAAKLNDGLLDVLLLRAFEPSALGLVMAEVAAFTRGELFEGDYLMSRQTPWLEADAEFSIPTNLDGEPHHFFNARIEVVPLALPLLLPADSPCLGPTDA